MGGGDGLIAGLAAAYLAAWVSVSLAPPRPAGLALQPIPLVRLIGRFLWGSLVAGVDVARRAFSPAMPLSLGVQSYRPALPPGPARNLFLSVASLMPGSLYTATDRSDTMFFHTLDVTQPLPEQLAEEEARVAAAVGVHLPPDARLPAGDGSTPA
jgi:multicomponent Na+:H+ antiporter subunit E